jgi:hypothetical protein
MEFFTKRNMVILALVQVGVVVLGSLAAGASHKWYTTFNMKLPSGTELLADYGFFGLAVPLIWVTWALLTLLRAEDPDALLPPVIYSGLFVLLVLLWVVLYAGVGPLFRLLSS